MHTSHTYHCHEHDAHKEHMEKPLYFDPFGQTEFTPLAII